MRNCCARLLGEAMSKKFIAGAVLCLMPFAASAADLPSRIPAPAPVLAAPMFTWSGFYAGVQGGWMQQHDKYSGQLVGGVIDTGSGIVATTTPMSYGTNKKNGFVGGAHLGYNRQVGALVYGLEADLEGASVKNRDAETIEHLVFPPIYPDALEGRGYRSSYGLQGSARARLGFAMDRTLFYVTGGLAFANVTHSYWQTISGGAIEQASMNSKFEKTRYGYTVGAGVAYALDNNWSLRAEYRFTDLGTVKHSVPWALPFEPLVVTTTEKHKLTSHAVRLGLSYAFGGPAPVVAKH